MLLQVFDFIELAGLLVVRAEQARPWRINGLARLRAAFAQSYPQIPGKPRILIFNHELRRLL
jgi:hypothetical protein